WALLQQIENRSMTLETLGTVFVGKDLAHVAFRVAGMREPFRAFRYRVPLCLRPERRGFLFENTVAKLLWRVWSVDFLGRFQNVQSELIAIALKKIVAPAR